MTEYEDFKRKVQEFGEDRAGAREFLLEEMRGAVDQAYASASRMRDILMIMDTL